MLKKYRMAGLFLVGLLLMAMAGYFPVQAETSTRPEVRALWVDAFHDGVKTPNQVDQLIKNARTANLNTLIVQVRRRGDAYYNQSIEPRTEDPGLAPGFDALQYLIDQAHTYGLEVHAWLNGLVAWNSATPPKAPNHVWNLHGPRAAEGEDWVSYYRTGSGSGWSDTLRSSYYLDPGHPDVVDYTVAVHLEVVKNYDIDGLHLDYTRYAGLGWGYNPTSLARYHAFYGTSGLPSPDDPRWALWKRAQTANLVRKIYLKAIALKPDLKVSSSVIAWGNGPVFEGDWERSRPYVEGAQDWRSWLEEGFIDTIMPMNYNYEWNAAHQRRYNQWIEWQKDHQYGRQIVIGPGIYMQYFEQSLEQIRRAQSPSALGNYAAGVSLYAYRSTNLYSCDDYVSSGASRSLPRQPHVYLPESNDWFWHLLSNRGGYVDPVRRVYITTESVYPSPAAIPDMPWKSNPTTGYLMGTVVDFTGNTHDQIRVTVEGEVQTEEDTGNDEAGAVYRETVTDGHGWFGLAELPPGDYRIYIEGERFNGQTSADVRIRAGEVAEVNFGQYREKKRFDIKQKLRELIPILLSGKMGLALDPRLIRG